MTKHFIFHKSIPVHLTPVLSLQGYVMFEMKYAASLEHHMLFPSEHVLYFGAQPHFLSVVCPARQLFQTEHCLPLTKPKTEK